METTNTCPKCQSLMERGFVIDESRGGMAVSQWAKGRPEKSFWVGLALHGEPVPIGTFRCSSCGYLESYASPQFAPK